MTYIRARNARSLVIRETAVLVPTVYCVSQCAGARQVSSDCGPNSGETYSFASFPIGYYVRACGWNVSIVAVTNHECRSGGDPTIRDPRFTRPRFRELHVVRGIRVTGSHCLFAARCPDNERTRRSGGQQHRTPDFTAPHA